MQLELKKGLKYELLPCLVYCIYSIGIAIGHFEQTWSKNFKNTVFMCKLNWRITIIKFKWFCQIKTHRNSH